MLDLLRLPRGAALAAERAGGARSFAVGFWFPIGSRHEAAGERGFVHFVEHMAFKGTARRGASAISREIDRVGGFVNAFTDRDSLCIHCLLPASEWRLAIDVLADMAFHSTFAPADFQRERDVIVSEILAARDDPEESSHDELLSRIWPGDPAARKIAGEPEDLAAASRDALYDFYLGALAPARLLVTAAGPIDPGELADELGRVLSSPELLGREPSRARAGLTPRFSPIGIYRKAPMEQVNYFEAVQLDPPFALEDYFALAALNGALGEASSSRLFQSLRERRGLCYSVFSAFSLERTECLWLAAANVSPGSLAELGTEMGRELDLVADEGLAPVECADAAARLAGSFEVALDDADFRMRRIARQVLFAGKALDEGETRDAIASTGPAEINAMCARLLSGKRRARMAYGRRSAAAARTLGLEEAKA